MTVAHYLNVRGPGDVSDVCHSVTSSLRDALGGLPGLVAGLVHKPIYVTEDPLPVTQDKRLALVQLVYDNLEVMGEAIAAPAWRRFADELSARSSGAEINHHFTTMHPFGSTGPADPGNGDKAVSFFVLYAGSAEDPNAFHSYYLEHHVPLVLAMPNTRGAVVNLPTDWRPPVPLNVHVPLLLVQAIFDDVESHREMLASRQRKTGLADFKNYPKFSGPVTHESFLTERIRK